MLQPPRGQIYGSRSFPLSGTVLLGDRRALWIFNFGDHLFHFSFVNEMDFTFKGNPHHIPLWEHLWAFCLDFQNRPKIQFPNWLSNMNYFEIYLVDNSVYDMIWGILPSAYPHDFKTIFWFIFRDLKWKSILQKPFSDHFKM